MKNSWGLDTNVVVSCESFDGKTFFKIPSLPLRLLWRHWETVGCSKVSSQHVFELCKHIYWFVPLCWHSTPQVACSLCVLLTEHEACSLPVVQGDELRLGEGTYSIHSSCWRIVGYSPLLWDRRSKCMLTQTPTSASPMSDRHWFK